MDSKRFDSSVAQFGQYIDRRRILAGITGLFLTSTLGLEVEAKKKKKKKKKNHQNANVTPPDDNNSTTNPQPACPLGAECGVYNGVVCGQCTGDLECINNNCYCRMTPVLNPRRNGCEITQNSCGFNLISQNCIDGYVCTPEEGFTDCCGPLGVTCTPDTRCCGNLQCLNGQCTSA